MPIDIGFLAFFVYGFWQGYERGIISTLINLMIYIFGFVLAFKLAPFTANVMQGMFHSQNPSIYLGAFVFNIVAIMFIARQFARMLEGGLRVFYLGIFNKVAGGVLMGFFTIVVYSVLVWFAVKVQFINEETLRDSKTYIFLQPLPTKAKETAIRVKPFALDVWGAYTDWTDKLEDYGVQRTEGGGKTYRPPDDKKPIQDDPTTPAQPRKSKPIYISDDDGIEE